MIFYTVYNTKSGEILFTGNAVQEKEIQKMTADGQSYLLDSSKENQFVSNGTITDMPPKPDGDYLFDYDSKAWVFNESAARAKALYQRDQLLKDGPDRINPIWFAAMTFEQQQAWADYRQALLDITAQSGFPMTIDWPARPDQAA